MPYDYYQDDHGNRSSFRLRWLPFMLVILFFLVALIVVFFFMLYKGDQNIDSVLKALGITGGTGISGFLASVWRKFAERRPVEQQPSASGPSFPKPDVSTKPVQDSYRSIPDRKLTRNFSLYEFIEAHPTGLISFIKMNWRNISQFDQKKAYLMAEHMQWVRDLINERYKRDNNGVEIKLRITSAWRCPEWEFHVGRNGTSEHTRIAADFQPRTFSPELAVKILDDLHKEWYDTVRGHQGGLAIKRHERNERGQVIKLGFIHLDFGPTRRWNY